MYARSAVFDAAVKNSHVVTLSADVLLNGVPIKTGLSVVAGVVEVDGTASVRRRANLTVVDRDGTALSALSVYGRELRVYRGIQFVDGTTESLALGVFRISAVRVNDGDGDRKISVAGFDRSRIVARNRFESPYTIAAGTNYSTAINDLLVSRYPSIVTSLAITSLTTPTLVFDQGADPWQSASDMATSLGCELFFDPTGVCIMRPVPDPTTSPVVWSYVDGAGASVLSVNDDASDEPGYNGVVVDGEPPNAPPVHSVVYDLNTTSPTYALGPYGKVPLFYRSQYITTQAQADAAAAAILLTQRGGTEQVKFTCIPHPAHEVGDLVRVADSSIALDDNYLLESFSIPLDLSAMMVTTRKRRGV
jgi:hypothetical protein